VSARRDDRRQWVRTTLADAAADFGSLSAWRDDAVRQRTLECLRDHPEVEEIAVQLGDEIPILPSFAPEFPPRRRLEMAFGHMMFETAFTMGDPYRAKLPTAKEVIATRDVMERNVAHALSLEPDGEGEEEKCDRYVTAHKQLCRSKCRLTIQP